MSGSKLIDGNVIDIRQLKLRHIEAVRNCATRKASPVLDATESFFLCRRNQPAVNNQRGGRVTVKRIETEDDQSGCLFFLRRHAARARSHKSSHR